MLSSKKGRGLLQKNHAPTDLLIDGVERETRISNFRFGLTFAAPIATNHTVRLTLASGARVERGADFDAIGVSYAYRWGGTR